MPKIFENVLASIWRFLKREQTVFQRLAFGMAAASSQVLANFIAQIILLPLYLTHWDARTYGIWLTLNAVFSLATTLELGHQNFLAFEFQMIGKADRARIRLALWSALPMSILLWACEYLIVLICLPLIFDRGAVLSLAFTDAELRSAYYALNAFMFSWLLTGSFGGIIVRALIPFGYYARITAWGSFNQLVISAAPAFAVLAGANLLSAALAYSAAVLIVNVPMLVGFASILKTEMVWVSLPSLRIGLRNLRRSIWLSIRQTVDLLRQHGIRVLITPLVGPSQLATFAANRTVANVLLQAVAVATGPLFPELISLMSSKQREKVAAAFHVLLIIEVAVLLPSIIWLQVLLPNFFHYWTRGKIEYDPILFWLFSTEISLMVLGTISRLVIQGANLVHVQLWTSVAGSLALIVIAMATIPSMQIRGVAVALVSAELIVLSVYTARSVKWLRNENITWPTNSFILGCSASAGSSIAVFSCAINDAESFPIAVLGTLLCSLHSFYMWRLMPAFSREALLDRLAFAGSLLNFRNRRDV